MFKINNSIDKNIRKVLNKDNFKSNNFNQNIFRKDVSKNSLVQVQNKRVFTHPGYVTEKDGVNRGVTHFTAFPGLKSDVRLRTDYGYNNQPKIRISSVSYKNEFNDKFLGNKQNFNDFKIGLKEIIKIDKLDKKTPVEVWEDTYGSPKVGLVEDFIGKDRKRRSMQKQQNYFKQMQGQNFMGMNAPLKSQDRDKIMFLESRDSDLDLDKFNKQYWKEIMQEKPISQEMPDYLVKPKKEEKEVLVQRNIVFPNTVSATNRPKQFKDDSITVVIPEKFRQSRQTKEYKFVPEQEQKVFNQEKAWRCITCGEVDYDKTRPNRSKYKGHKCNWQLIESDESEDRKIYKADGKDVIYRVKQGDKFPSPKFLHKVYKKIPDDKNVPVVLQTPKQYLEEYIKNQEVKKGIKFTDSEKSQYMAEELPKLKQVSSRFTTYHNKYMEPRVVIFPQKKVDKERTEDDILHEYGHELWEKNKNLRKKWNNRINKKYSPTVYGTTDKEEDMAESFVLYKKGKISKVQMNPNFTEEEKKKRFDLFNKVLTKDTGKNRSVLSRLADEHASYRADSPNYEHDNTKLSYGTSQSINLKMKKLLSDYKKNVYTNETSKLTDNVLKEKQFRKGIKGDLSLFKQDKDNWEKQKQQEEFEHNLEIKQNRLKELEEDLEKIKKEEGNDYVFRAGITNQLNKKITGKPLPQFVINSINKVDELSLEYSRKYNIPLDDARELIGFTADYNIENDDDVKELMETKFIPEYIKGKGPLFDGDSKNMVLHIPTTREEMKQKGAIALSPLMPRLLNEDEKEKLLSIYNEDKDFKTYVDEYKQPVNVYIGEGLTQKEQGAHRFNIQDNIVLNKRLFSNDSVLKSTVKHESSDHPLYRAKDSVWYDKQYMPDIEDDIVAFGESRGHKVEWLDDSKDRLNKLMREREPLVPPITIDAYDVKHNEIGEGRHRIASTIKADIKNIDVIIPENVFYEKGKLIIKDNESENRMPWKKFEVIDKTTNKPFTIQAKSEKQVRHEYRNAGNVRDLGLWTSNDDEAFNKQKTLNKYIQYTKNKETFKNG